MPYADLRVFVPSPKLKLLDSFREAARLGNRPVVALALEALRLRFGSCRIGWSEYLDYGLFRDDLSGSEKARFGGWRAQAAVETILVDDYSRILSLDKLLMYTVLEAAGIPCPAVRAVFGRALPAGRVALADRSEVVEFVTSKENLPVYVKPAFGAYGRGNALIASCHGEQIRMGDGRLQRALEFAESLDPDRPFGWVFQEPIEQHPEISARCGGKVSGLRIHTVQGTEEAKPLIAVWKVNTGGSDSDNFQHGKSGNLLAAVELQSGRVIRVAGGLGGSTAASDAHPATGKRLEGFVLPHWREVLELACRAHKAFPGYACPGWDIALTRSGPSVLEVNFFGDVDLPQLAHRKGFFGPEFSAALRDAGLPDVVGGLFQAADKLVNRGRGRSNHWRW